MLHFGTTSNVSICVVASPTCVAAPVHQHSANKGGGAVVGNAQVGHVCPTEVHGSKLHFKATFGAGLVGHTAMEGFTLTLSYVVGRCCRVPEELKKHYLSDSDGGQYSTNLDRNRYGNDDQYLFTGGCTSTPHPHAPIALPHNPAHAATCTVPHPTHAPHPRRAAPTPCAHTLACLLAWRPMRSDPLRP